MKKRKHYFVFLGVMGALAILIACGNGEIVDLAEGSSEYSQLLGPQGSLANITDKGAFISDCSRGVKHELCEQLEQPPEEPPEVIISSSSSETQISSSSTDNMQSSSSVAVITPSSSSITTTPSSSSTVVVLPSSSAGCTGSTCAAIPAFTCSWTPATVVSGDKAAININITGNADGCAKSAFVEFPINNQMGINPCFAQTAISAEEPVITSGKISGSCDYNGTSRNGSWDWPTSGTITAIKGVVTCGSGASLNSESKTCSINITAPPKPTITGAISFSNVDYTSASSRYFYIGSTPEITHNIVITNGGAAQASCGEVQTRIEGNTTAAGAVKAIAYAICRGSEQELSTITATVVANPTLGSCTWNKDILAKGQDAIPTATLSNSYGRCGAGAGVVSYSGGFPKTLTENDVGTISDVVASADCGTKIGTLASNCPALTVKGAIYEIGKGEEITLPNEETIVKVTIPTSNWQHNDAYVSCNVSHLSSGTCTVAVAVASTGCGGKAATLSGQNYLGRESIGRPTCEIFDLKITPTSNCNNLKCKLE